MAKHKVWVFFVDLQFTIPNQTLRRQVQGLHGLEHYELVNIGALQNSCELPDDPEIFLYSILDEPSMNFPPQPRLGEVGGSKLCQFWADC